MEAIREEFLKRDDLHIIADEVLHNVNAYYNPKYRELMAKIQENYPSEEKEVYSQDWSAYNKAQSREKIELMVILDELLAYLPLPEKQGVGRKPVNLRDKVFYVALQCYNAKSSRRCISDLTLAHKLNYVSKTPHFNTVLKVLQDEEVTSVLKWLVQMSCLPLQSVEKDFAVDSSGFSTSMFSRWFDYKWGKQEGKERIWRKIHITCGTRTNIITAVNITPGNFADSPQFEQLVQDTSKLFNIEEVSADKAYSSKANLQFVKDLGAIPFIPFKSNATKSTGCKIWREMYKFFTVYPQAFNYHYHKRSNVESTFHMLKRKFGNNLRSKTEVGQTNELLAKCLCHNICVLIQESYELGINIDFQKCAEDEFAHK